MFSKRTLVGFAVIALSSLLLLTVGGYFYFDSTLTPISTGSSVATGPASVHEPNASIKPSMKSFTLPVGYKVAGGVMSAVIVLLLAGIIVGGYFLYRFMQAGSETKVVFALDEEAAEQLKVQTRNELLNEQQQIEESGKYWRIFCRIALPIVLPAILFASAYFGSDLKLLVGIVIALYIIPFILSLFVLDPMAAYLSAISVSAVLTIILYLNIEED